VGPVTALAGVCLQDVERGEHEGGKRLLASRLRPVSSKATHPPSYLPHHNPGSPEALLHAVALSKLTVQNIAAHFDHSFLEAVRSVPELCGPGGPWEGLFASLPDVRE